MLSKDAKALLRLAQKQPDKKVEYKSMKSELGWDLDKIKSVISQLVAAGLAYEKYYSPMVGSRALWGIVLTEEGRNSKLYFWTNVGKFLFKSIAVPIVVAFLTALITSVAIG